MRQCGRWRWRLVSGLVLLWSMLPAAPLRAAEHCFQETGFCVQGRFLAYWQEHGELALNGYLLSEERQELLEDGRTYTVQYFERVRMEYHGENAPPYDVLLGQFGRRALLAGDEFVRAFSTGPVAPLPDAVYFPETGHNLRGRFLDYWRANGGLAQFGYPVSEEGGGTLVPQGQTYLIQYFERARFEYHPEYDGTPYAVLVGQFGRRMLRDADLLAGEPSFNLLYLTSERVQWLVHQPATAAIRAPGVYQAFERGVMLWRGDTRSIYVFCGGTPQAGNVATERDDTWTEGQPIGGGPGPRPGLYEPRRGFGKLWREDAFVRDCLGYATTADETGYTIAAQPFRRRETPGAILNWLLSATTPEGRFIYVRYDPRGDGAGPCRPGPCYRAYERYPDPLP